MLELYANILDFLLYLFQMRKWSYRDSTRKTRLKKITLPYDPLSMSHLLKVAAHFMLPKWPYFEIQFA